ncbi:hypothetical protein BDR26DRAFT_865834 [Obelidium mucronatum]|nr:hypothetical protein BDR26DRAFT_865834 [Obelidium mucronatum]
MSLFALLQDLDSVERQLEANRRFALVDEQEEDEEEEEESEENASDEDEESDGSDVNQNPATSTLWCQACRSSHHFDSFSTKQQHETRDNYRYCLRHSSTSSFDRTFARPEPIWSKDEAPDISSTTRHSKSKSKAKSKLLEKKKKETSITDKKTVKKKRRRRKKVTRNPNDIAFLDSFESSSDSSDSSASSSNGSGDDSEMMDLDVSQSDSVTIHSTRKQSKRLLRSNSIQKRNVPSSSSSDSEGLDIPSLQKHPQQRRATLHILADSDPEESNDEIIVKPPAIVKAIDVDHNDELGIFMSDSDKDDDDDRVQKVTRISRIKRVTPQSGAKRRGKRRRDSSDDDTKETDSDASPTTSKRNTRPHQTKKRVIIVSDEE